MSIFLSDYFFLYMQCFSVTEMKHYWTSWSISEGVWKLLLIGVWHFVSTDLTDLTLHQYFTVMKIKIQMNYGCVVLLLLHLSEVISCWHQACYIILWIFFFFLGGGDVWCSCAGVAVGWLYIEGFIVIHLGLLSQFYKGNKAVFYFHNWSSLYSSDTWFVN